MHCSVAIQISHLVGEGTSRNCVSGGMRELNECVSVMNRCEEIIFELMM